MQESFATRDSSESNCGSDPWDSFVRPQFDRLLDELKPSLLLTKLYSQRLITKDELKQLRTPSMSDKDKSFALLLDILPEKQPVVNTFEEFLSILRSVPDQEHIAALLKPSNSGSTQQTLHSSAQRVPRATRVSSNPREPGHTHASFQTRPLATATAANAEVLMAATYRPNDHQPKPATSRQAEMQSNSSSATEHPNLSSLFHEFYRLLKDKRHLVAQRLIQERHIDKVLEIYQLDDCGGNVGRLSDYRAAHIKRLSDNKSKTETFLDVVIEGGVDSAKRLSYTLLSVQPEILDLLSPLLRKQIEAEASTNVRQALEDAITKLPKDKRKLVIVVVGKTGVGKSTLINCILGKEVAKIGFGKPVTTTPKPHHREIRGINVEVWDTPGFRDHSGDEGHEVDRKYLTAISAGVTEIDLLLFCLQVDSRIREDDGISIRILTLAFGKELWKRGIIALTKANNLEDHTGKVPDDKFLKEAIKSLTIHCQVHLTKEAKLNRRDARDVPCVPTGSMKYQVLKDGTEWLPEMWVTALERMTDSGATFLIHLNRDRLCLQGSATHVSARNDITAKDAQYATPIPLNSKQAERVKAVENKSTKNVLRNVAVVGVTALAIGATGGVALAVGAVAGAATAVWNWWKS